MEQLIECYTVHGNGGWEGCFAVQEKLQNYGLCSYTRWDPDPPNWRFFFETNLDQDKILETLGHFAQRYGIRLE